MHVALFRRGRALDEVAARAMPTLLLQRRRQNGTAQLVRRRGGLCHGFIDEAVALTVRRRRVNFQRAGQTR